MRNNLRKRSPGRIFDVKSFEYVARWVVHSLNSIFEKDVILVKSHCCLGVFSSPVGEIPSIVGAVQLSMHRNLIIPCWMMVSFNAWSALRASSLSFMLVLIYFIENFDFSEKTNFFFIRKSILGPGFAGFSPWWRCVRKK